MARLKVRVREHRVCLVVRTCHGCECSVQLKRNEDLRPVVQSATGSETEKERKPVEESVPKSASATGSWCEILQGLLGSGQKVPGNHLQGKKRERVSLGCKCVSAEQAPQGASRHSVDRK